MDLARPLPHQQLAPAAAHTRVTGTTGCHHALGAETTAQCQPEDAAPAGAKSKFLQAGMITIQCPFPCKYQGELAHVTHARPRHDAPCIVIRRLLR